MNETDILHASFVYRLNKFKIALKEEHMKEKEEEIIIKAIENMQLIEFDYDDETRIVEPHCYGQTTKGNDAIRAFQVGGYSSSGVMGWKLYDLSKATSIALLDEKFNDPREGYREGDSAMSVIYVQL